MGLCASGPETLWVGTLNQLWRFENAVPPGQQADTFDKLDVPQAAYTTGEVDALDIALDAEGRPVFVNTLFSCLAAPSESHSFRVLWKPPFISKLAAGDRCHLNGLAMENGASRFVTAVSTSGVHEGWREHRRDGGVIVDVPGGEIVARGLAMPHSPQLHQGRLFVLNSGAGGFGGVDLRTGDIVHSLSIERVVHELYDVALLPGVVRPAAFGFKSDEIRRTITLAE